MGLKSGFHVLIVDDNSPDGTGSLVDLAADDFPDRVHIIRRQGKMGLGTAYIAGFKWAIDKGYQLVCEMDADFSHDPRDLDRLFEACSENGTDVVIGSRYVKGGSLVNWPLDRKILSYGASVYVRLVTGMPIKDPTAGFICYRREVLENIDLDQARFVGYAFQIEMKYKSYLKGYYLRELPITFTDREKGVSKMNKTIVSEAIKGVIQLRLQSRKFKSEGSSK